MNTQPEALRLALLQAKTRTKIDTETSAELCRLHAQNAELLEALKELTHSLEDEVFVHDDQRSAMQKSRAAIAKAEGQQ